MIDYTIALVDTNEAQLNWMECVLSEFFKIKKYKLGKDLVKDLDGLKADLVMIDFDISDMSSLDLQQEIRKNRPDVETAMISVLDRSKCVIQSMRKRAMDYVFRSSDKERFITDVCKLVRYLIEMKTLSKYQAFLKKIGLEKVFDGFENGQEIKADDLQKAIDEFKGK